MSGAELTEGDEGEQGEEHHEEEPEELRSGHERINFQEELVDGLAPIAL